MRIGLMQVTPAAGRDTAKKFGVTFDQSRLMDDIVYNVQIGAAELGNDIAPIAAPTSSHSPLTMRGRAGPRNGSSNMAIRAIPRSIRSTGSSASRSRRRAITSQRMIENMQVYRALIENNPKLMIDADLRRGG